MKRRLGLAISRGDATLVGLEMSGRKSSIVFTSRVERGNKPLDGVLEELLRNVPPDWRRCELSVALSHSLLACCDCFEVPYRTETQLELVAPSLAEGRCAGESAEDLAVDAVQIAISENGMTVEILAIQQVRLANLRASIRKSLPHVRLIHVGSIAAALAKSLRLQDCVCALGSSAHSAEGYALLYKEGRPVTWRGFPLQPVLDPARKSLQARAAELAAGRASSPVVHCGDRQIEFANGARIDLSFAAATAAAMPACVTTASLLRGAPDYPKRFVARFKQSILGTMAAAAVLMVAAGLYFNSRAVNAAADLDTARANERKLWQVYLPAERPIGPLLESMQRKIAEHNKSMDANRAPSALAFWSEIGAVLPQPDPIGLTLDTLQLGPDGGRWMGRVTAKPGDPLANAASFERALNNSGAIAARGEFETKDAEVHVRMRLDYSPRAAGATKP